MSDIIDNSTPEKSLLLNIETQLGTAERARFAVGYFFLSGFGPVAEKLSDLKELKLLIGNVTNRSTIEALAESHRHPHVIGEVTEQQRFPKQSEMKEMLESVAQQIREVIGHLEQSETHEQLIKKLSEMVSAKTLKVRVYTKGALHAKAYIFDSASTVFHNGKAVKMPHTGTGIVGSSNLTLSGLKHNTELNVFVHGDENHKQLVDWFERLWNESQDFDAWLMREMSESWAMKLASPKDIYWKTLYTLVADRLAGDADAVILGSDIMNRLAEFQKQAVYQAIQVIKDYDGVFVSDVVGLGKSYIGAAIVKYFEEVERNYPLIICPAALVDMWERYNEVFHLHAKVVSMGRLTENEIGYNELLDKYRDRDFVLIDESHNFRYADTQRYRNLQPFTQNRRCCLLTATPRNKSAWDVYNQLKLFHVEDTTRIPIQPNSLKEYFGGIEDGNYRLQDLLVHVLRRRRRRDVLKHYGKDEQTEKRIKPEFLEDYLSGKKKAYVIIDGKHCSFPVRKLKTIRYSLEDTYPDVYDRVKAIIGKGDRKKKDPHKPSPSPLKPGTLSFARYSLWDYVIPEKSRHERFKALQKAGNSLRGLLRVMLFKRFESSVHAFRCTIERLQKINEKFMEALDAGIVPAGESAQRILYDHELWADDEEFFDALRDASTKYSVEDFDIIKLRGAIEHDIGVLGQTLKLVSPIGPKDDAKLQELKMWLSQKEMKNKKRLIFTEYSDTASYLMDELNPGHKDPEIAVVSSNTKGKMSIVGRFAPMANPEFAPGKDGREIFTLIATDVLSEGLNLQDCGIIINYDLHWNPVRLIQRLGRIDRILTDHDEIYAYNFLPETGIEKHIGLQQRLAQRISDIHETIGEDAAILDSGEQINRDAMYAIYDERPEKLSEDDDDESETSVAVSLADAEERFRQMRSEDPDEFDRISRLPDGIRSVKKASKKGAFVLCKSGSLIESRIVDPKGKVIEKDIIKILQTLKSESEKAEGHLPSGYNTVVSDTLKEFANVAMKRQSNLAIGEKLRPEQRWVIDQLKSLFRKYEKNADLRSEIELLDKVYRKPLPRAAERALRQVKLQGLKNMELLNRLKDIFRTYELNKSRDGRDKEIIDDPPVLVCSEALLE